MADRVKVLVVSCADVEVKWASRLSECWALPAQLSEAGKCQARRLAVRIPREFADCRIFGVSPLMRAQQTLFELAFALGIDEKDLEAIVQYDIKFWTMYPDVWGPSGVGNKEIIKAKRPEVRLDGQNTLVAIRDLALWARDMQSSVAIAIAHGGPLDSAIMLVKNSLQSQGQKIEIGQVDSCEGAIFTIDVIGKDTRFREVQDFLLATIG